MLARMYQDPMDSFRSFSGELDRMFNTATGSTPQWVPSVDIKEDENTYQVVADVPGVEPKDIDISLEEGVLTVKGERNLESEVESEGYTRSERAYGSFTRRFTLPDTADADNISAKTEHGVLKLLIPKKEKVLPKKIAVEG